MILECHLLLLILLLAGVMSSFVTIDFVSPSSLYTTMPAKIDIYGFGFTEPSQRSQTMNFCDSNCSEFYVVSSIHAVCIYNPHFFKKDEVCDLKITKTEIAPMERTIVFTLAKMQNVHVPVPEMVLPRSMILGSDFHMFIALQTRFAMVFPHFKITFGGVPVRLVSSTSSSFYLRGDSASGIPAEDHTLSMFYTYDNQEYVFLSFVPNMSFIVPNPDLPQFVSTLPLYVVQDLSNSLLRMTGVGNFGPEQQATIHSEYADRIFEMGLTNVMKDRFEFDIPQRLQELQHIELEARDQNRNSLGSTSLYVIPVTAPTKLFPHVCMRGVQCFVSFITSIPGNIPVSINVGGENGLTLSNFTRENGIVTFDFLPQDRDEEMLPVSIVIPEYDSTIPPIQKLHDLQFIDATEEYFITDLYNPVYLNSLSSMVLYGVNMNKTHFNTLILESKYNGIQHECVSNIITTFGYTAVQVPLPQDCLVFPGCRAGEYQLFDHSTDVISGAMVEFTDIAHISAVRVRVEILEPFAKFDLTQARSVQGELSELYSIEQHRFLISRILPSKAGIVLSFFVVDLEKQRISSTDVAKNQIRMLSDKHSILKRMYPHFSNRADTFDFLKTVWCPHVKEYRQDCSRSDMAFDNDPTAKVTPYPPQTWSLPKKHPWILVSVFISQSVVLFTAGIALGYWLKKKRRALRQLEMNAIGQQPLNKGEMSSDAVTPYQQ